MTTLYYCMGGGLGHITRFAAFCRYFAIKPALMTNCELVRSGRIIPEAGPVLIPDEADNADIESFRIWISKMLNDYRPQTLIIDAFPGGILGELCDLPPLENTEYVYLARILDLPAYHSRLNGPLPQFAKIYRLEKLGEKQQKWLHTLHAPVENLVLPYPAADTADESESTRLPHNCWLIIHSGGNEELEQLWQFACQTAEIEGQKPEFAMASPGIRPEFLPTTVSHYDVYPADSLITQATRVFSAAGFNIMQQMQNYQKKHHVLPMPRALDDQFLRYRLTNHR
ncbi:MAG: hypothetical protein CVV42_16075 [Candidatus Riflebacteria bacterium HGW-Riflebacteria-2]|jgi:hypothetical protein|nr:MAG: hypothetical protein CVV42_16075 [Candidatus Riflebacteria bacterium HGW-Riflebacteria-2]